MTAVTLTRGLEPKTRVGASATGSPPGSLPNRSDCDPSHNEDHGLPRCCQAWIAEQAHGWAPRHNGDPRRQPWPPGFGVQVSRPDQLRFRK
jgi:hypothetical protein